MSLRVFHIVFVVASIALSVFGATWGIQFYMRAGSLMGLAVGVIFALFAIALVPYGVKVFAKLRALA